ncbi:MAG: phosphatase PAP2 family protein [Lachnospiraceae bacterium]
MVSGLYEFDTNTNVCPSLHVIGAVAVCISAFHTERFQHIAWKISFVVVTLLICASTVFLKQHSIIDVFCAIPVCVVGYFCAYHLIPKWTEKRKLHKNV